MTVFAVAWRLALVVGVLALMVLALAFKDAMIVRMNVRTRMAVGLVVGFCSIPIFCGFVGGLLAVALLFPSGHTSTPPSVFAQWALIGLISFGVIAGVIVSFGVYTPSIIRIIKKRDQERRQQ